MTYGFIMAAGNQTRFNSDIPKVLSEIDGETILDKSLKSLEDICDVIYLVVSAEKANYFTDYNIITIESGFGCGDAVMKALNQFVFEPEDMCVIQWGDCIIDEKVYHCFIETDRDIQIPCVWEDNPYVLVEENGEQLKAFFSKYGEVSTPGYHDLSIFYGTARKIRQYLNQFRPKIIDKDGKGYIHKHGNEMQFLDVLNETSITGIIVPIEDCKAHSFNTQEELEEIKYDLQSRKTIRAEVQS